MSTFILILTLIVLIPLGICLNDITRRFNDRNRGW